MLPTLPHLTAFVVLAYPLVHHAHAQDVIHFMDNTQLITKVLEVGIDSITHTPQRKNAKPQKVPKAFIKFIEYQNGQRYFIEHTKLYMTDGKIILALVKEYDEKNLAYQDVFSRQSRAVPLRKVAAIHYDKDHRINFMDKINLRNGDYAVGQVLEIKEDEITYENARRRRRKEDIDRDMVLSIEFTNGFEQKFTSTQSNN
ncbi:MAG: hypothetical protein AAF632_19695 [Bacteroidota bacterium]